MEGVVQGVGMRPTVWRHASQAGVSGWVRNTTAGVDIRAVGAPTELDGFVELLRTQLPPAALITDMTVTEAALEPTDDPSGFHIVDSHDASGSSTSVSPDLATCPRCTAELFDPADRRYHYPFINCTDCGPRLTVIETLPYDRERTSMRSFTMCPECDSEYHDPSTRRFDAQPDACFACGPLLHLVEKDGSTTYTTGDTVPERRAASDALIDRVASAIEAGGIVALKGLGGYQLVCDATNDTAVRTLRARKHRSRKAFAVMAPDLITIERLCSVDDTERDLLTGSARPIVLLRKQPDADMAEALADSVSFELPELGMMLPTTPLHHLLLARLARPLVMTSGNVSDEAIVMDDFEAREKLLGIADVILAHDRTITTRLDDAVVRVIDGHTQIIRRARGHAPTYLPLPAHLSGEKAGILALGADQKQTFARSGADRVFISQHIGDLENAETLAALEAALESSAPLFRDPVTHVVADLHPGYFSTRWAEHYARTEGLPLLSVQHHHAHIASVLAEHDHPGPVIGIAFDGTGYGEDGTLWGGEFFLSHIGHHERLAHLGSMPLPGGAAAIMDPRRSAWAFLVEYDLADHPGAVHLAQDLGDAARATIEGMLAVGMNVPRSTSAGRLLDIAAALSGICTTATYEGEPAIMFEAAMEPDRAQSMTRTGTPVPDTSRPSRPEGTTAPLVLPTAPLIERLLDDVAAGTDPAEISHRFHSALARLAVDTARTLADTHGCSTFALSGGVFMNRFLTRVIGAELAAGADSHVLMPLELPPNDGCIAYGQVVEGLARIARDDHDVIERT